LIIFVVCSIFIM